MNTRLEIPKHIGIILDGNRRFAKHLMKEPWKGHEYGAEKVKDLLDYAKDLGIKEFTLYCLSIENIKSRPKKELKFLYKIFFKEFKDLNEKEINENKIKIRFIGNLNLLPNKLKNLCLKLENNTKNNTLLTINFAIAYGGRQEIIEAVKKIIKNKINPKEINKETFEKNLYLSDSPDMIIRTGGEIRTSNFLPWQSAYSEWFFLKKMWPEFEKKDLKNCIKKFKNRKRNFGK